MRVVVVIPAWNEAGTIAAVVEAAREHGDVVVVDDGSADGTGAGALGAGAKLVAHASNLGYDAALRTGFAWGHDHGYDVIASIDGDAQHDPALLRGLLEPVCSARAQMSLGVRSRGARAAERAFSVYTNWRFGVPDILCGAKAFSASLYRSHRDAMALPSIGTGLALAALRSGVRPELVPIPVRSRDGATRFGTGLRPNLRILRALGAALLADLRRRR